MATVNVLVEPVPKAVALAASLGNLVLTPADASSSSSSPAILLLPSGRCLRSEAAAVVYLLELSESSRHLLGKTPAEAGNVQQALEACSGTADEVLAFVEAALKKNGPFLVGQVLTAADLFAAARLSEIAPGKGSKAVKQWSATVLGLKTPEASSVTSPTTTKIAFELEELKAAEHHFQQQSGKDLAYREPQHPVLPVKDKKNVLITSALPYVNNVPHLGNIIGCVLSADVFARFSRLRGHNVLYVCGTDEYGTATETKAIAEGLTPQQICDKYHAIHSDVYKWFNISFDHFGRTTTEQQTAIAQDIFWKCYKNDYVISKVEKQWYCTSCQASLADRFVEGTCPDCGYDDARGDQCDQCGHPLHAHSLKSPRCRFRKDCGKTPELRDSTHLYLCLDRLQPKTEGWFERSNKVHAWSANAQEITRSWFKKGLDPRAITRDLKWGTPVPLEGYTDKVFYVWFDAPIGYLSITANYTPEWEKWWKNPDQVELYQFMAKDNVPFHSIIFPSSLLGTGDNYTFVRHLSATEYLNYEGDAFSKSRGIGVFGNNAQDSGIPSDVFRFYLLYMRPEVSDTSFDWDDLIAKHNNDLLKNLGNFVHRAVTFVSKFFFSTVPEMHLTQPDIELIAGVNRELAAFNETLEHKVKIRDALRCMLAVSRLGNQYMQDHQPWKLVKGSKDDLKRAGTVVGVAVNLAYLLAIMMQPFLPDTSARLLNQLNAGPGVIMDTFGIRLAPGHRVGTPETLFTVIPDDLAKDLRARYGAGKRPTTTGPTKLPQPAFMTEKRSANAEEIRGLRDEVATQGDKVRDLKKSGAEKDVINKEVEILKQLKNFLAAATGEAVDGNAKSSSAKKRGGGGGSKQGKANDGKNKQTAEKKAAPKSEEVIRLGKEISEQARVVRGLKDNNAPAQQQAEAQAALDDLKRQLAEAKTKGM